MSTRFFLPILLFAYLIATFVWRSYVVWKKTGINPIVFKGSDSAHDFVGRVTKLTLAVVVAVVIVYSLFPSAYQYLVPIPWLERSWLRSTGFVLLVAALIWTFLAQAQMGESWRIGIDNEQKTKFVQRGIFHISRNPTYVGIVVTLVGLLFVIPNAITLMILAVAVVLINIQTRLEEEYLKRMHGDDYVVYTQQVRRWI